MKSLSYNLLFILSYSYCFADSILPSYERDEGDWPVEAEKNMKNVIDRWFIDIKDAKCKPLEYRGIKGNYNNFASKGLCEMHGRLTQREKLQGCKKPMHPGHCVKNSQTKVRYYFDQTKARCETFNYNGCGGSFNRYTNEEECYLYCLNKKNGGLTNTDDSKINTAPNKDKYLIPNSLDCEIKPDVKDKDPSTGIIADTKRNKCAYAAVSLDSNTRGIFSSFGKCVKTCFPNKHDAVGDGIKKENKRVQACDSDPHQDTFTTEQQVVFRYYYDPNNEVCKRMESGPRGENTPEFVESQNSFPTMEMCHSYCGAANYKKEIKIEEACTQQMKGKWTTGKAFKATRYYYKNSENKCKAFEYQGYGGNSNNFKTGDSCRAMCDGHYNEGVTVTIDKTPET